MLYASYEKENNGGYNDGDPPLTIPNREVKPISADDTAIPSGKVGSRQPCETFRRNPEGLFFAFRLIPEGVFFALPIQIFYCFRPRCPVSAAAIPFLSTKIMVLSTETAFFVDRRPKMMVLSTETAFFVDRKCFVLKRSGNLRTAAIKRAVFLEAVAKLKASSRK